MSKMPVEYRDREQTWLKHRVLKEYVSVWAHKLGSSKRPETHLWYVDCFAGPWRSRDTDLRDTSPAIGLAALKEAAATWTQHGRRVRLHAVFVEKGGVSHRALTDLVASTRGEIDAHVLHGEFGEQVEAIDRLVGDAPAFILVDPTGWKGVKLEFITRLARRDRRDVLVNVMYDHLNRFKDDRRGFLRTQMAEFFGIPEGSLAPGLDEVGLMAFYRERMRELSGRPYVADLAVPVPDQARTYFRLVLAAGHPAAIKLFREVEERVIGREAAPVRQAARDQSAAARTGQALMFPTPAPPVDPGYGELHTASVEALRGMLPEIIRSGGPVTFGALWPGLLCDHHLTLTRLRGLVRELVRSGQVVATPELTAGGSIRDETMLRVAPQR